MTISINTVRDLANKVYGENNWSLEENYCDNVGRSNRSPANSRKVYRISYKGQQGEWLLARELVDIFTKYLEHTT